MTAVALETLQPSVPLLPAWTSSNTASTEAAYTVTVRATLGDLITRLGGLPLLALRKNNLPMLGGPGPTRGAKACENGDAAVTRAMRELWASVNNLETEDRFIVAHFVEKVEAALGGETEAAGNGAGRSGFSGTEEQSRFARNISQPLKRPLEIVCTRPGCQNTRKVPKQGALPKWCVSCAKIVKREHDAARRAKDTESRAKAPGRKESPAIFIS